MMMVMKIDYVDKLPINREKATGNVTKPWYEINAWIISIPMLHCSGLGWKVNDGCHPPSPTHPEMAGRAPMRIYVFYRAFYIHYV